MLAFLGALATALGWGFSVLVAVFLLCGLYQLLASLLDPWRDV